MTKKDATYKVEKLVIIMKDNFKMLLLLSIALAFGVLTFIFAYETDFHFLLVQAQYIFIILLIVSKQKKVFLCFVTISLWTYYCRLYSNRIDSNPSNDRIFCPIINRVYPT